MVQCLWYTVDTNKGNEPKGVFIMYEFRNVRGHVEVYDLRGQFLFSADNEREAREELKED